MQIHQKIDVSYAINSCTFTITADVTSIAVKCVGIKAHILKNCVRSAKYFFTVDFFSGLGLFTVLSGGFLVAAVLPAVEPTSQGR